MAMFGKAKEQIEFVKKAREIQKKLQHEIITIESGIKKSQAYAAELMKEIGGFPGM